MTQLKILTVPDERLKSKAAPVTQFGPDLEALIEGMFEAMYAAGGRGLAAPQVGEALRLFVIDMGWKDGTKTPVVFINPELVDSPPTMVADEEACLSIPGECYRVIRPLWIDLAWTTPRGTRTQNRLIGNEARCAAHELDHLDGLLISDTGMKL